MQKLVVLILIPLFCFVSCTQAQKKEMQASEIFKLTQKSKPILISEKIILDDLDFTLSGEPFALNTGGTQVEVASNIFFVNCVFMGKVTSNRIEKNISVRSIFKNNLVFFECDFRDEVNFDNMTVFGSVNFSKSTFRKKATFNNVAVWSKDSYFSEMTAEDIFSMIYSLWQGNVNFMDAHFEKKAIFQETAVRGKLSFNNALFKQGADFDMAEIGGRAFFNYATFEDELSFLRARFNNSVEFIHTGLKKPVKFEKTYFADDVLLDEETDSTTTFDFSDAVFVKEQKNLR